MRVRGTCARAISVLIALSALCAVFLGGCAGEPDTGGASPSASTPADTENPASSVSPLVETATPGYIQVYHPAFGYGYEYPDDWVCGPDEVLEEDSVKYVETITRRGEGVSITTIVKTIGEEGLVESATRQYMSWVETLKDIQQEGTIVINGREAREVIYNYRHINYPKLVREVTFESGGVAYIVRYRADEELYKTYEGVFKHILNSLVID
jgi:hypothetical protein